MHLRERSPMPRRGFLSGLASLPLVGGSAAIVGQTSAAAACKSDADRIGEAWHALALARGLMASASDEQDAATAQLPWWARSGPTYIDHSGQHVGIELGWPAIQGVTPPERPGSYRRLRWSFVEIEKEYRSNRNIWGESTAVERRNKLTAELNARCSAAEIEKADVGLLDANSRYDAAYEFFSDAEDRVSAMAEPSKSPAAAAALFLIELVRESNVKATVRGENSSTEMVLASIALGPLLPNLPKPLALDVEELLNNPERPIAEMRMSRGITGSAL